MSTPKRPEEDAADEGAPPPRLGALEARVMDALWDHGPDTIRGIIRQLPTTPAYTTIATVLANLQRKGFVTAHRENHSARYRALRSREEHVALVMRHALGTSPDRAASMLHFVASIADDDLALLRAYVERGRDERPR